MTLQEFSAKPVTILTGFLGAGKTTFLNELIHFTKQESRPFVIENEFGETNIDAELVIGMDDKVFSLSEGCVCCNLNDDLLRLLQQLWLRKSQFDELVIEATGIADPSFIAMPFLDDPQMERFYQLDRVICLVDARHVEFQLKNTEEARKQIAFSDILLIVKTDLVDENQLIAVKKLLQDINPWAKVLEGNNKDGYPLEEIKRLHRKEIDQELMQQTDAHICGANCMHEHHEALSSHHHHHEIESFSFSFTKSFDLQKLQDNLLNYLNSYADNIYRVKGFIDANVQPLNRLVVQLAGNMLNITDGQAWGEEEIRTSKLVFIGKELHYEELKGLLETCLIQ